MTDQPKKKQQRKTPAQRAQQQYDTAVRIADRLDTQWRAAAAEADRLEKARAAAVRRREFLAGHPDLPTQKKTDTTTATPTSGGTPA